MILEVSGVACAYDGTEVLSGVTLRLSPGDFVAVAGPNGSGTSTLIRALSRVLRPRLGSALLDGSDLYAIPARQAAQAIAVLPQETTVEFEFSCEEVVLMGRAPHLGRFETEREVDRAAAREAMERTSTWELRKQVWEDPRAMIGGSDAGAHLDRMCGAPYTTRFLGDMLRGRQLVPIEEAVRMITDQPAPVSTSVSRLRLAMCLPLFQLENEAITVSTPASMAGG